ncbi:MAG: hypothetical protein AAF846_20505 [Chloroflexota bacterium]
MNFEQIKKHLKDGYESNGFDVIAEPPSGEAEMRYPDPETYDVTLKISKDDIQDYARLMSARGEFVPIGNTGLANSNFRESLLVSLDPSVDIRDVDDLLFKRDPKLKTYVEIDTVSLVFANYFRFEEGYVNLCLDRILAVPAQVRKSSAKRPLDVRYTFAHPLSVRVYDIGASSATEAIRLSDELIEGALFTLGYELGVPLILADSYPKSRYENLKKLKANQHIVQQMILPDSNFRHDLVRYYQAGIASPIATHQFLSFYQILELFFQDVTHNGVHDELYHLLRSEDFKPDNATLARIVTLVEANKKAMTTSDLLESLLRQHIGSNAIKQFILAQNATAEETVASLAQRIVTTRDAIMNAGVNGLPPNDKSIALDVPLVKFLAEQVIVATKM